MADARRDANRVTSLIGVDSIDDTVLRNLEVDGATGRLLVTATISGGGAGGTSSTDDAAFTVGSGNGTPVMGLVTTDSVDSGDVGVLGMLANRQLKVTLFDSGGSELAVGGGTQYTEDAAAAANPIGNALNLIRDDARGGSLTTTDGDNVAARGTNAGELYVKHTDTIPVTQSGTWNVTNVSGTVSLPTGAATAAKQDTGNTSLSSIDGKITAVNTGAVVVSSSALPSGASTAAKQPALGTAGTASADVITVQGIASMTPLLVNGSGVTQPVSAASLPLPTGASTSANQTTGNTSLATIAGAVSGTEMQVDVISSALPTGAATAALQTQPGVDIGDVTVNNASGAAAVNIQDGGNSITVDQATGSNLHTVVDSGTITAVTAITNALPAGTNNIGDVDVLTVPRSQSGPGQPGTAIDSYSHAAFNLAAGANQVLVSSAPSKQIWVYGIGFTVNVAGTVSFQDEDDTAITGVMNMAAAGGMVVAPSGNFSMPIWKLGTDKDLEVDVVTSELDGWIDYAILSV